VNQFTFCKVFRHKIFEENGTLERTIALMGKETAPRSLLALYINNLQDRQHPVYYFQDMLAFPTYFHIINMLVTLSIRT